MKGSTNVALQVTARWQRVQQTGLVLVFISMFTLLMLLALVGVVISHAPQGVVPPAVPHGSLMASATDDSGGTDGGPTSTLGSNGDIHIGG